MEMIYPIHISLTLFLGRNSIRPNTSEKILNETINLFTVKEE